MDAKKLIGIGAAMVLVSFLVIAAANQWVVPYVYQALNERWAAGIERLRVEFRSDLAAARSELAAKIDAARLAHMKEDHGSDARSADLEWIREAFLEAASQRGQILSQVERLDAALTDAVLEAREERRRMRERLDAVEEDPEQERE